MNAADWANKLYHDKEYTKCVDMAYPQQTDADVLFYAALSLEKIGGRDSEVVPMLRRALFHKPNHAESLRSLVWALKSEDLERLAILERMARSEIADSDDLCLMGELYTKNNRLDEAHHWYRVALTKEPHNSLALLGLTEVHIKLAIGYLQDTEDEQDIDLDKPMSANFDINRVMRFIYTNITKKKSKEEDDVFNEFYPQA